MTTVCLRRNGKLLSLPLVIAVWMDVSATAQTEQSPNARDLSTLESPSNMATIITKRNRHPTAQIKDNGCSFFFFLIERERVEELLTAKGMKYIRINARSTC